MKNKNEGEDNMRKITTIIVIALFILNVTGCSSNKTVMK